MVSPVVPFQTDAEITTTIPQAVSHLKSRGVLAYPTETIYGLGTAIDAESVQALVDLKGREEGKPFLLLVSDIFMLNDIEARLTPAAKALALKFWPGPLTLILPTSNSRIPKPLLGPNGGVAVRWTPHSGMARLIKAFGAPITSTSANIAGTPTLQSPAEIEATWKDNPKLLVLDGGLLDQSLPSTVVDCMRETPIVVREGAIPKDILGIK